jgi:hypothetical protein
MHMRWSAIPHDPETGVPVPSGRPDGETDGKWLSPDYDFLGEFFSSHVNPVFWRLHGWVDDRINNWFEAHRRADPDAVKETDLVGVKWFATGDWVACDNPWSGPAAQIHQGHPHFNEKIRREVLTIVARPESEDGPQPAMGAAELVGVVPISRAGAPRTLLRTFSRPFFAGE